jgi:hypothetical protein
MNDVISTFGRHPPRQLYLRVEESEIVLFSVGVKLLKPRQSRLIQKCRIVFLKVKEFMIVMLGALILTIIILWSLNFRDNHSD